MSIRVMVSIRVAPADREGFEKAYLDVAEAIRGTPGHIRDELLRDADDDGAYILFAEWNAEAPFRAWVDAPEHLELSAPLYPYLAKGDFSRRTFHVVASPAGMRSGT